MQFKSFPALTKIAPLVLFLAGGVLLLVLWHPLVALLSDPATLRAQVEVWGVWGPIALILLNLGQVVVAPLPGYPIVFVAGILYGWFWGAVYANLGLLLSGTVVFWLTRWLGRPLAERFIERSHSQRVERLLKADTIWIWFIVLFLPTGDYPYFAAGLSKVSFRNFFIALCAARLPFTWLLTYAAEQAVELPQGALVALGVALALLVTLVYWQKERVSDVIDAFLVKMTGH